MLIDCLSLDHQIHPCNQRTYQQFFNSHNDILTFEHQQSPAQSAQQMPQQSPEQSPKQSPQQSPAQSATQRAQRRPKQILTFLQQS
jgi:hypothetical protein